MGKVYMVIGWSFDKREIVTETVYNAAGPEEAARVVCNLRHDVSRDVRVLRGRPELYVPSWMRD